MFFQSLSKEHALAFAMGLHSRLGSDQRALVNTLDTSLVKMIVDNCEEPRGDVVECFLATLGVESINDINEFLKCGNTPLIAAIIGVAPKYLPNPVAAQALLECADIDVNQRCKSMGLTPLGHACADRDSYIVRILMAKGCDPSMEFRLGNPIYETIISYVDRQLLSPFLSDCDKEQLSEIKDILSPN